MADAVLQVFQCQGPWLLETDDDHLYLPFVSGCELLIIAETLG